MELVNLLDKTINFVAKYGLMDLVNLLDNTINFVAKHGFVKWNSKINRSKHRSVGWNGVNISK